MKCIKFLLSGIMLGILSLFLFEVDMTGTASLIAILCALVVFIMGLLMGHDEVSDHHDKQNLPQKMCPRCHKSHDFDYPKCPFCGHEY